MFTKNLINPFRYKNSHFSFKYMLKKEETKSGLTLKNQYASNYYAYAFQKACQYCLLCPPSSNLPNY